MRCRSIGRRKTRWRCVGAGDDVFSCTAVSCRPRQCGEVTGSGEPCTRGDGRYARPLTTDRVKPSLRPSVLDGRASAGERPLGRVVRPAIARPWASPIWSLTPGRRITCAARRPRSCGRRPPSLDRSPVAPHAARAVPGTLARAACSPGDPSRASRASASPSPETGCPRRRCPELARDQVVELAAKVPRDPARGVDGVLTRLRHVAHAAGVPGCRRPSQRAGGHRPCCLLGSVCCGAHPTHISTSASPAPRSAGCSGQRPHHRCAAAMRRPTRRWRVSVQTIAGQRTSTRGSADYSTSSSPSARARRRADLGRRARDATSPDSVGVEQQPERAQRGLSVEPDHQLRRGGRGAPTTPG